ncbi:Protein CBG17944 [Caenorhabditis briggsae]|uniref:Uncharacterized protein n=2 Tax=Caenorhabditis briggsae TaxID=6238 RepID=A0AAE9IPE1_CAEBR|nr:Protein CBG17944 [Caenorhabditis briggsae]ULU00886.1 hypothetical protein L3Y34_001362 [Caenorhabditis briggsae]UMM23551.1 hypothetical protein L5515_004219 [Caenorhabditis briggsae]CAP35478.2 Protein CBG17944 [Caenorhabditis briggsae]
MSSNNQELQYPLPPIPQARSISDLVRVEVEEPPRKMRMMFGEAQIVSLRSDGLRSRMMRTMMKKTQKQKSDSLDQNSSSNTLNEVIDEVASGQIGFTGSESEIPEPTACSSSSFESVEVGTSSSDESNSEESKKTCPTSGNRSYHPPKQFHAASTMITHKRKWTYQTSCHINAEEQKDDNQIGYAPDPFLPMPRGRRIEISTATRMNYAAQRVDNRKFRGQAKAYQSVRETEDRDSITCEKCKMKYFSESRKIQERITYISSAHEEVLPTVVFDCPVCKEATNAAF